MLRALQDQTTCRIVRRIATEGLAKLTDFGIALAAAGAGPDPTRFLVGKLPYMAPEQAARRPLDFRADLFSLGAVLFELLSLRRIRDGDDEEAMTRRARDGDVDWDGLPAGLGDELTGLLRHALAFRPEDRPQSTDDLARSLEHFICRDGYGPTIQTVEAYLRQEFPDLYRPRARRGDSRTPLAPTDEVATMIMDETTVLPSP